MALLPSTTPDITEAFPASLGTSVLTDYPPSAGWDVSFGPLGFLLQPSEANPYQRGTEQSRKQQIDTSDSPGEQSLSSWWVRSQDSWDMGAGVRWFEPGTVKETEHRFGDSSGVDPWTPGEVRLLKAMGPASAQRPVAPYVAGLEVDGVKGYVEAYADSITWTAPGVTPAPAILPGGNATQPAAGGGLVWVGHDGGVTQFSPTVGIQTRLTCTGRARAWWAKARLIVAIGPTLYEVPANALGAIGSTAGTLLYTHPSATWVWSDVTETAGAILASGYSGGDSAIFRFGIENNELNVPILTGAAQVGRTPPGERITAMSVYLGTSLVLGTSMGVRVGQVSEGGDVQYGPLTVETQSDVLDVTFRDRFAYLTVTAGLPGGASGAVRVDLSAQVGDTGRYAWAWDAAVQSTAVATSLALVDDRVVICVGNATYEQSATEFVESGWFNTGGIRFGTVEPKAFRLVRTVVATNGGHASLTATAPDGSVHRIVEFTDSYRTEDDVAITIPGRPVNQFISITVTLSPSQDDQSPVLSALSVKAQPAGSRVRLYSYPVRCFDIETDRSKQKRGREGGAYPRLAALESLESSGHPVQVIDNRTGESFIGQIDSVDFSVVTPPDGPRANFGGVATVRVRKL